jgi:hypothetical protein
MFVCRPFQGAVNLNPNGWLGDVHMVCDLPMRPGERESEPKQFAFVSVARGEDSGELCPIMNLLIPRCGEWVIELGQVL